MNGIGRLIGAVMLCCVVSIAAEEEIEFEIIEETEREVQIIEKHHIDEEYTIPELKDKLKSYTKLHNTGRGLLTSGVIVLSVGGVAFVSGLSLLINGAETYDDSQVALGVVLYIGGYIGIYAGVPLTVTGAVLNGIGKKKAKEYDRRLKLSVGANSVSLQMEF
jgi:hypothetical protein